MMETVRTFMALVKRLKWWIAGIFVCWLIFQFVFEEKEIEEDAARINRVPFRYEPDIVSDEEWRQTFSKFSWKAAHNSVERKETLTEQLNLGCRSVELDLMLANQDILSTKKYSFIVTHNRTGKANVHNSPSLESMLQELRVWSLLHPEHLPVTLVLDLKDSVAQDTYHNVFSQQFDITITEHLGRELLFTPADFVTFNSHGDGRDPESLNVILKRAKRSAWPTIGFLKGKIIVIMSGDDSVSEKLRRKLKRSVKAHKDAHA